MIGAASATVVSPTAAGVLTSFVGISLDFFVDGVLDSGDVGVGAAADVVSTADVAPAAVTVIVTVASPPLSVAATLVESFSLGLSALGSGFDSLEGLSACGSLSKKEQQSKEFY